MLAVILGRAAVDTGHKVSSYAKLWVGLGVWRWVQMRSEMRRLSALMASGLLLPAASFRW